MDNQLTEWLVWTAIIASCSGVFSAFVMYLILRTIIKKQDSKKSFFSDSPDYIFISQQTFLEAINIANANSNLKNERTYKFLEEINDKLVFMQGKILEIDENVKQKKSK